MILCRHRPPQSAASFTLIELLAVMAILSVLMAIIIPALRKARSQAKRAVCQNNLKHLAVAWHYYLDEHNGFFLKGLNANWNYGGKQGDGGRAFGLDPDDPEHQVPKPLNPMLGIDMVTADAEVFECPADKGGGDVPTRHYDYKGTSYATNLMLVGQDQLRVRRFDPCRVVMKRINGLIGRLKRNQLLNENSLVLMGDGGWLGQWDLASSHELDWHDERAWHNIAFMDAHVEFLRIRKGLHVTPEYTVLPFVELQEEALECQEER